MALSVMGGIAAAHWLLPSTGVWSGWMCIAALLTALAAWFAKGKPWMAACGAILFCGGIGGLLTTLEEREDWTRNCPAQATLYVRLAETPSPRERSWFTKAEVLSVDGHKATGRLTLFLRKDSLASTLRYGDRLLIHTYPDITKRSAYTTSDHWIVVASDNTSIRAKSEALRMRLVRRARSGPLSAGHYGLAEALALGWRADLDPATQSAFRDAGIAHLLAVSGLHVGLVAAMAGSLMFWTGKERKGRLARGLVQIVATWGFAVVTGFSPSSVRAAIMFSLFIIADIMGRRTPKINLLAAAAIITLTSKPTLLFDLGWQLSYCAVAGILLARPVITLFNNKLWQAATVSIAATLSTLPVVVSSFHRLPAFFLIANIVIVPLAALLLATALVYIALPCMATGWPFGKLADGLNWLTLHVADLPGAVIGDIHPGTAGMLVLTAIVIALLLISGRIVTGNREKPVRQRKGLLPPR